MLYKIPHNIDPNKVFLVNFSELEGRLEPEYYRPSIATLEKRIRAFSTHKLKDYILSISGGATPSKTEPEKYYSNSENGIPFLRVQNLQTNGELLLDDCVYINEETHNGLLKRSQVSEGDLLVKITGVGRMAIASVAPKGFVGNTNQHMVVIKTVDVSQSKYLASYLNLDCIERIASRHATGGTRPALDFPSLKNLPIDNIDFSLIEIAIQAKKQKEREAKEILDSIDDYLLSELDIERPSPIRTENGRFFYTSFHNLMGSEWAPLCIKNNGKRSKSTLYKEVKLSTIATIAKGQAITSKEIVNGNYPVIAGGQNSPYSHNQYNYKGNIVTISASGAYSGYVWYHNYPIFASDCSVIFSNDENVYLTKYIYEILRLRQQEIYLLQKGAGQPHVYPSDIANLTIPAIPLEKQQDIVAYCQELRNKAELLQKEGCDIISTAKGTIEQMIIGN